LRRVARLYHFSKDMPCPHSRDGALCGRRACAKAAQGRLGHAAMKLIMFYVVFVLIGESLAYLIGRTVEIWSKAASLPVFLACFFLVFWAAWRLAVRVT
jgi:hypothetical protein